MAVTAYWYAPAFIQAFDKEIDFLADNIAITLHTATYAPNQDTHDYFDDLTNQLSTANGYTAEDGTGTGKMLGTKANTNTNNVANFGSANVVWTATGAGFTAAQNVVSDVTPGTTATDPLLWWQDFGANETASGGGTFTITPSGGNHANITATNAVGFP